MAMPPVSREAGIFHLTNMAPREKATGGVGTPATQVCLEFPHFQLSPP